MSRAPGHVLAQVDASIDWSSIPDGLVSELNAGRVVIFMGAGFSIPAGFPNWKQLIFSIAEMAEKDGLVTEELQDALGKLLGADWPSASDLDQAAQILADALERRETPEQQELVQYMSRRLVPELPLPAVMETRLQVLRELPAAAILSTNYNPLLSGITPFDASAPAVYRSVLRSGTSQSASTGSSSESRVVHAVAKSSQGALEYVSVPRPIVQIHGNLHDCRSVVLSREGYRRLLYQCPHYMTFLRTCFATRTILFVGFSFTDAYINELRSEIMSLFGEGGTPNSYAIVNDQTSIQCQFRLQHEGTHCINFNTRGPGAEGWGGFDRLWQNLGERCRSAHALGQEGLGALNVECALVAN